MKHKENETISQRVQTALDQTNTLIEDELKMNPRKFWVHPFFYGHETQEIFTEALILKYATGDGVSSDVWPHSHQYPTNIKCPDDINMIWLVCINDEVDHFTSRAQLDLKGYRENLKKPERYVKTRKSGGSDL